MYLLMMSFIGFLTSAIGGKSSCFFNSEIVLFFQLNIQLTTNAMKVCVYVQGHLQQVNF